MKIPTIKSLIKTFASVYDGAVKALKILMATTRTRAYYSAYSPCPEQAHDIFNHLSSPDASVKFLQLFGFYQTVALVLAFNKSQPKLLFTFL